MKHLLLTLALTLSAYAERTVSLEWDAQSDAKSFAVYAGGVKLATVSTNKATITVPDAAATLTVTASNDGGDSIPSAPLVLPSAPASPKGLRITKIIRTTITTP